MKKAAIAEYYSKKSEICLALQNENGCVCNPIDVLVLVYYIIRCK